MTTPASYPNPDPPRSPLFDAQNAGRYDRQGLIREYESTFHCRLAVMIDSILYDSVTFFEEILHDCDPDVDLHLMLNSPGGVGEVAVRLARSAQSHCRELTVIVPDQAKSAGTLLTLGAHQIIMGPVSDLGPIDPQFVRGWELVAAKDIIAAHDDAVEKVKDSPDTYPIYVTLLGDVTAIMVQQARAALNGTEDILRAALSCNPDRTDENVRQLLESLRGPLIDAPQTHGALFGAEDAIKAGLPVQMADLRSSQWRMLWRLWAKYFALGTDKRIYESVTASQVMDYQTQEDET